MLQPDRLPARLHAALVVALARPGEAGLEQVMAGQRLKALGELAVREQHPPHRRLEVVVDTARRHPAEVLEGAHVAVEEGQLVLTLVEPDEVAPRVHQPHQELPRLAALARYLDGDLEEVDLRLVARAVHQRHVDLGTLAAPLAQVVAHERHPDRVALLAQLPMQPRRRQPLLRRRALPPLLDQFLEARLHRLEDRPLPRLAFAAHRLAERQVAPHRVAADTHLACHPAPALALDQHLVPEYMDFLHSKHPLPQRSRPPPPNMLGAAPGWITIQPMTGSPCER